MQIPLVCFITFNRLGLTIKNLNALLSSTDDFELYIIDNNSTDDTWRYICGVNDRRIKMKKRFEVNYGVVYAINYALSKRKDDQYFILIENDVCILTNDFITKFMEIMDNFQEVGLLGGVRENLFEEKNISPQLIKNRKNGLSYYKNVIVLGCCNCIRPEVFKCIGYWNEETCGADIDMGTRINKYTKYVTGYLPTVKIEQTQHIDCDQCDYRDECTLDKVNNTCFSIHKNKYYHAEFAKLIRKKLDCFFAEVDSGRRSIYCASTHDSESIKNHYYNKDMANDNFQFFYKYGN